MKHYLFLFIISFFACNIYAQDCSDANLWQGQEPLAAFGIDTTYHWWAITQPFSNQFRLVVDGEESDVYYDVTAPIFSPDGEKWASFVYNGSWFLYTHDDLIELAGSDYGEIIFSPDSKAMAYSYKNGSYETIALNDKILEVNNRTGKFYLSNEGQKYAFMGYRSDKITFNINGLETPLYEEAFPIGFWHDGGFLYAAKSGSMWQIFKDLKPITDNYYEIKEAIVNLKGSVLAFAGKRSLQSWVAVVLSDQYYEPLISKPYDNIYNLSLHPEFELLSFNANVSGRNVVVFNSAEYYAGDVSGRPQFSYNGDEMFFIACGTDCFVSINGKRYTVQTEMGVNLQYAVKPGSETLAYVSNTSLVVRNLTNKEITAGLMVDEIYGARYNWRMQRYEAIGRINQRLYLLVCKV